MEYINTFWRFTLRTFGFFKTQIFMARDFTGIFTFPRRIYRRIRLDGISNLDALAICLIMAFGLYAHLAVRDTFNATGDFPPAVSYALNFKLAVANGQWLPRWVIITREFTFGGGAIDGTTPTADSPIFLYYYFLSSALAFPLLSLGVSSVVAVQLVVCLAFGMGAWALYLAGRSMKARPVAALVGAYAYIISPWLLSNFYHRGDIGEAVSHAGLPYILLGVVWLSVGQLRRAMFMFAFSIAYQALNHAIFLMLGALLCALLGVFYFFLKNLRSVGSLAERLQFPAAIGVGGTIGLLLTSWQWLPALLSLHQIELGLPTVNGGWVGLYTDLSGAIGFPRTFTLPSGERTDFFFTIGWWTIPAAISLLVQKTDRLLGAVLFGCFGVFFSLAFCSTLHTWHMLPNFLSSIQFTFRLLAFVSVLGAIAIPMLLPRMSWQLGIGLAALMTISLLPVFEHQMLATTDKQRMTDQQYLGGYEYNNFYSTSRNDGAGPNLLRVSYSGWLQPENLITFNQGRDEPAYLRIRGVVSPKIGGKARVYLINPSPTDSRLDKAPVPVSQIAEVTEKFDITLVVNNPGRFRLIAEPSEPEFRSSERDETIKPGMVSQINVPLSSYVFADDVQRTGGRGYWREFRVAKQHTGQRAPDAKGLYTVELPMIFNQFSVPRQRGLRLAYESDFNHRILVRVADLTDPIVVDFELPWPVFFLTGLGLIGLLVMIRWRKFWARLQVLLPDSV